MNSPRPYLLRALIDWIVDNGCTPYMAVATNVPGVLAVQEYATDDRLVLNLSASATRNLVIDNQSVSVDCRFQGRPVHVRVPVGAVVGLYARESGMGMSFEVEVGGDGPTTGGGGPDSSSKRSGGPKLTVVK